MSLILVVITICVVVMALHWLPSGFSHAIVVLGSVATIGAAIITCSGALVILRYQQGLRGKEDIFLKLNRSREPGMILTSPVNQRTSLRRWLAQRFLGHDLVVGDLVEVKTWDEIRATLDAQGCLDQLPFMPEMLSMCGKRARVFRCMHRLFDYRKTRRMRHMDGAVLLVGIMCDGASHGNCEAACHTIWKSSWLKRIDQSKDGSISSETTLSLQGTEILQYGTQAPNYACQLTQLSAASMPIGKWSLVNFFRPLVSGNVAPLAFIVGWLTHLFNEIQHQRQGVGYPQFTDIERDPEQYDGPQLKVGDHVIIRSPAQIRATLNDNLEHRGMGFETDMLKYCGQRHTVQLEIRKLIDIVTGEMRTMKTPAYLLQGIHFSGERQQFNAQYEPLFWRAAWMRRDGTEL